MSDMFSGAGDGENARGKTEPQIKPTTSKKGPLKALSWSWMNNSAGYLSVTQFPTPKFAPHT